ncbi:MAG: nuclear transport factor 2 family protein [Pseudomonadota bacterium]
MSKHVKSPAAVIEAYAQGTRMRDTALLKSIFHEKAVMTGWLGPDFLCGGPEPFYAALEANDVGEEYTCETVHVTVHGKIATAQTSERNLFGLSFTNYFHMAELPDATWCLTSKPFRHD